MSQAAGIKEYEYTSGRARGLRAIDVNTGSGLMFTVLPGRGMDLAHATFRGKSLTYITKNGLVASQFYEPQEKGFFRSFSAGLMTTCGLSHIGDPCVDHGEAFGLHGRISNIEAEDVGAYQQWDGDDYLITIRGRIRQTTFYGEYLTLDRIIKVKMGENKIYIHDKVYNDSSQKTPLMILYHFNFGYPLLSENAVFVSSKTEYVPYCEFSAKHQDEYNVFEKPHITPQQAFIHCLEPDKDGNAYAGIINKTEDMGCLIYMKPEQIDEVCQWKMMNEGEYVLGIEPILGSIYGRAYAREKHRLYEMDPGETREFDFVLDVISGEQIEQLWREM